MKIRNMLGLMAIGGAVYAHRRRGGEFTLESFKQSAKDLWSGVQDKARPLADKAQEFADEAKDKIKGAADDVGARAKNVKDDVGGYGSSGYGYGNGMTRR